MGDSHSTGPNVDQQPGDEVWELIAEKVDQLVAAWEGFREGAAPPRLADFTADLPAENRPLVLQELIKADLELRWQDRRAPLFLEDYLQEFPELGGPANLPQDLIYEEIQIRRQSGDEVDDGEMVQRFPAQMSRPDGLLGTVAVPIDPVTPDAPSEDLLEATTERGSVSTSIQAANIDQLREGDSIDDFDLLMALGRGTFACVYLARQRSLERLVALKISKSVGSEPRTLAQLDHPNIVRVFDQRSSEQVSIRLLYMELVPGGTLKEVIDEIASSDLQQRSGRVLLKVVDERISASGMAPPEGSHIRGSLRTATWPMVVCQIGARLADGLSYAHLKGVLHRDIKPANVLLTSEGSPKLADFNISFQGGRADEDPNDSFGGSLAYMSPEQLEACHPALGGSPLQVREPSDIYSVGVVLWELLTGSRPFEDVPPSPGRWAASLQRMLDQRLGFDPQKIRQALPATCPESLRQVLTKCLDPAKKRRYRSAQQLADALRLCLHPRCWRLMQPPQSAWARVPLRFPVFTALMATLLPSVFAAIFNFVYNKDQIQVINELPDAKQVFMRVQAIINGVAFPVGIGIAVYAARRAAAELRRPRAEPPPSGGSAALTLGHFMARLALTMWVISGLAYPIGLHLALGHGVTVGTYVHFGLSLALCGMLAGTYPFFLVTMLGVRWFIPELIRREIIRGPKAVYLQKVRRLNRYYLILTASVPLMGILLILLSAQSVVDNRHHLIIASITGLAGFGLMFWLHRVIDEDVVALQHMTTDDEDDES